MMGIVNGIIDDGSKVFGSGGRLYPDAKPSAAPESPVEPAAGADERLAVSVPRVPRVRDWRGTGSTVLELAGISAVSYGAFQVYPPAGWITAGVALTVLGVAMGVDR